MTRSTAARPRWPGVLVVALLGVVPVGAAAQQEATLGQWSKLTNWPISTTHTSLLPNGKVLFWGEYDDGYTPYLWDPNSGKLKHAANLDYNGFCGGHALLPDGTLLEVGGHVAAHIGFPHASVYDPGANKWTDQPDMNAGRWYPTATPLANGDVLVMSGEMAGAGDLDPLHEVFEVATKQWRELTGAKLKLPYFPRAFLAPNGKVFVAGTQPQSYWIDTTGTGHLAQGPQTVLNNERTYGGAVMYDVGKVLLVGGGIEPTETAETIDLNAAAPKWTRAASMSSPRRQHNTTLLPDGTVLVNGGSSSGAAFNDPSGDVPYAEVWDPATDTWTKLAAADEYRGYHSTGLLLPDGRVLTGGGRGPAYTSYQVFSPPYLFRGDRPNIDDAPTDIWPGAQFFVKTEDAASIAKVTLVRPGTVTHAWNMGQRLVPLQFTTDGALGKGLVVSGPQDNNVAPAGYYMLFLVNADGVPSVAQWVHLVYGPDAGPPPPLDLPSTHDLPDAGTHEGPTEVATPSKPRSKGGCSTGTGVPLMLPAAIGALALLRRQRRRITAARG